MTNESIDLKLKNRNIIRLEDYRHNGKIKVQCIIDNHVWNPHIGNLLTNKHGCPKCSKNVKLSNDEIDQKSKEGI